MRIQYDDIQSWNSHALKHSNATDLDNVETILKSTKSCNGRFVADKNHPDNLIANTKFLRDIVENVVNYSRSIVIRNWLNHSDRDRLSLSVQYKDPVSKKPMSVGIGVRYSPSKNTFKEYETEYVKLILEKDPGSKFGFSLITAYPDITVRDRENVKKLAQGIKRTNKDLTSIVKQTERYKKSSDIEKAVLLYQFDNNSYAGIRYDDRNDYIMLISKERLQPGDSCQIRIKSNDTTITFTQSDEDGKIHKCVPSIYSDIMSQKNTNALGKEISLRDRDVLKVFTESQPKTARDMKSIDYMYKEIEQDKKKNISFNH